MLYSDKGESVFLLEWEASAVCLFLLSRKQKARATAMLFPSKSCNMGQWVKEWSNMRQLILLKMYVPAEEPWMEIHLSPIWEKKNWISAKMIPVRKVGKIRIFRFNRIFCSFLTSEPLKKRRSFCQTKKRKPQRPLVSIILASRRYANTTLIKQKKLFQQRRQRGLEPKVLRKWGKKRQYGPSRPLDAGGLLPRWKLPFLDWCFVAVLLALLLKVSILNTLSGVAPLEKRARNFPKQTKKQKTLLWLFLVIHKLFHTSAFFYPISAFFHSKRKKETFPNEVQKEEGPKAKNKPSHSPFPKKQTFPKANLSKKDQQ